jgi:hypothetical protein
VTGGFSRTAVNDAAGARTPLASIVTAVLVLITVVFLTPLFSSLPQAALGAIIIVAVLNLVDVKEMRHIAHVKRSDLSAWASRSSPRWRSASSSASSWRSSRRCSSSSPACRSRTPPRSAASPARPATATSIGSPRPRPTPASG